jgi:AbiU2
MATTDPKILTLRQKVEAAQQEFDMAVTFHEVWKPAAYDTDLHARMGTSYATQAFRVIQTALRREMVLSLMRIWDRDPRSVGMRLIIDAIQTGDMMNAITKDRVANLGISGVDAAMRADLARKANEAIALAGKYDKGGSHEPVLERLRSVRDTRLAHRQVTPVKATGADLTDQEIEDFYQDNSKLIRILLILVNAHAYNPDETAGVFRQYAGHFWAGMRGEQTEGHPNYRPRPAG